MKQVTAVEWLVEQLNEKIDFIPMQKWDMIRDIVQQAKEMEKEQIITSWHNGYENQSPMIDENNCGQQYYNETYKKTI